MSTEAIGYSAYNLSNPTLQQATSQNQSQQVAQGESDESENGSLKSQIRNQINALLANIPKGDDGKLSFQDIKDYLDKEEKLWDDSVKADLAALNVDITSEFPLSYDAASGTVTVAEGHPDKALIDKYFELNPEKVEKFEEIIQLGKMTKISSSTQSATQLRRDIQQSAMSIWFEDNSDPTTWFSGGGMMFGQGQSTYTGLDIRV